ncbi:MAG: hypothetical protein FWF56_00850 [Firmicutes bacterium]|nr:hypothetical protein [Bacillota bacterium]MCL1953446.1 hypothetical protein [Bacillota bacterium]
MKEFKNFKPKEKSIQTDSNENVYDSLNKYSEMDREQLMQQLVGIINTQKSNGTYDKDRINQFLTMASSMLTPEQSVRMKKLIDELD